MFRDASVDPREKLPFHAKFPVLEKDFNFLAGAHDPVYEVRKVGNEILVRGVRDLRIHFGLAINTTSLKFASFFEFLERCDFKCCLSQILSSQMIKF